jgi:hypothetical protein
VKNAVAATQVIWKIGADGVDGAGLSITPAQRQFFASLAFSLIAAPRTNDLEVWRVRSKASPLEHSFAVNGTVVASKTSEPVWVPPTGTMTIAANHAGTEPWTGDVAEIVLYNRALEVAEMSLLDGYFANRYVA